jgi:arsenite methyltransferase
MRAARDISPFAALEEAVEARYTALATSPGSLSCGGALEVGRPRPGETVVDLGCGRGGDAIRAAAMVGPAGASIGVDANEAMLAAARGRAGATANVRFVRADLAAVPLPDGAANVVVSSCAVNHARDKGAVYREIHRLLRPGGRFAVSDVIAERELPEAVRRDAAAWAACYGGAIPEAEYLAAIHAAGFVDVHVVRRTAPYEKGGVNVLSITVQGRRP